MRFQLPFPLLPIFPTPFYLSLRRIHCATSPVIAHTGSLILMFLFPIPVLFLFSPNLLIHDALPRHSTSRGNTVSQKVKQANVIAGLPAPSDPTMSSEIEDSSQVPKATSLASLVHTSSRPTDTSPPRAQDIPPAATLSRALQSIVVPCAERDTREILSTASMPAHTPTVASSRIYTTCSERVIDILRRRRCLRIQFLAPCFIRRWLLRARLSSTIPCLTLTKCRVPCPLQWYDTLPSNPQCRTAAPTCSWTREYREYGLCECSVTTGRAFPSVVESV